MKKRVTAYRKLANLELIPPVIGSGWSLASASSQKFATRGSHVLRCPRFVILPRRSICYAFVIMPRGGNAKTHAQQDMMTRREKRRVAAATHKRKATQSACLLGDSDACELLGRGTRYHCNHSGIVIQNINQWGKTYKFPVIDIIENDQTRLKPGRPISNVSRAQSLEHCSHKITTDTLWLPYQKVSQAIYSVTDVDDAWGCSNEFND